MSLSQQVEKETQPGAALVVSVVNPQVVLPTPQRLMALLSFALLVLVISAPHLTLKCGLGALRQLRTLLHVHCWHFSSGQFVFPWCLVFKYHSFLLPLLRTPCGLGLGPAWSREGLGLQGASFQTGKTPGP